EATLTEPPMLTLSHSVETLANGKFRVTLTAAGGTPYPTGSPYKYCRVGTTGNCGFTSTSVYTIAAAGTYTFRARDRNGCVASINVMLPPAFGPGGTEGRGGGFASDLSEISFALSPNPFDNQLVVNTSAPLGGELKVKILDATGRLVVEKTWPVGTDRLTIEDTGDWPSGLFFVQITDAAGKAHTNLKAVKAN
ncbi:MAG: T9SS type A sorting domain-containing protein, partial [Saprospiraceae bacterium]